MTSLFAPAVPRCPDCNASGYERGHVGCIRPARSHAPSAKCSHDSTTVCGTCHWCSCPPGRVFSGCQICHVPLAGRTDPQTSHEAAETIRLVLGELQLLTLWTLRRIGTPATTHDLGRFAAAEDPIGRGEEWHRQRLGRRISELSRATPTLITAESAERDAVTRMRCLRWSLTAAGMQMSTPERVHSILRGGPMSECAGCATCREAREMVCSE